MAKRERHDDTRERLLKVAGETFAEKGFRATTVREICDRAGANLAAISYHFGGKDQLYRHVLGSIFAYIMGKYPPDLGQDEARTPRERLFAFVRSFLLRLLDPEQPARHRRLIAREMAEPSPAMREAIKKGIRKAVRLLKQIVAEILGPEADKESVDLCVASVVGQCLFYHHGRHMAARALPHVAIAPENVDNLARHIADFSLAGIKRRRTK
jgi:AcrR family transcriptional regulator